MTKQERAKAAELIKTIMPMYFPSVVPMIEVVKSLESAAGLRSPDLAEIAHDIMLANKYPANLAALGVYLTAVAGTKLLEFPKLAKAWAEYEKSTATVVERKTAEVRAPEPPKKKAEKAPPAKKTLTRAPKAKSARVAKDD